MRIVVTGREGQVVQSLLERAASRSDLEIVAVGRPELDLADPQSISLAIAALQPDFVISAAAYTAVDKAEDEPELAHAVNAIGAGAVAAAARSVDVPVIHLSTDYVFPGDRAGPHIETAATGPKGVYGASKLAGETAVAAANPDHVIIRTAWVYSPFGKNFLKTMLALAATRDRLTVVGDQIGNPTSALNIADAILAVVDTWHDRRGKAGIYHFAGTGETSWAGFATEILRVSGELGGPTAEVAAITTAEYPTKAMRPADSRLDTAKFTADYGFTAPDWQASTRAVVTRLIAKP
ncbi:MAG: dTDP-4-dehydrorhamnose reductase [Devosia sp.]|nr:dTDP-4-dehydrorhamnose reductase [Devosia sp.]